MPDASIIDVKNFMEADGGRKVTMAEMKALTSEERKDLCAALDDCPEAMAVAAKVKVEKAQKKKAA